MTTHPFRRRGRTVAAVLAICLSGALAACSAANKSTSAASPETAQRGGNDAAAPAVPQPGGAGAFGPNQGGDGGGTATKPDANPPPTLPENAVQRSIIYNGSMTVQVTDVNGAADRAETLAQGAGGYTSGDARQTVSKHTEATVVLRVPAERFESTMSALATLGTSVDRQVTSQDVTSQVIDVGSRIKSQQASVDRVRALLAKATTIGDVQAIESELTQRESDLESLEAQLAGLKDLSALSTITLTLVEPDQPLPAAAKKPAGKGFLAGLKRGWKSFQSGVSTLLTFIGTVLPYAVTIALVLWLVVWVNRRRHARGPVTAQLATAGGPPLPPFVPPPDRPAPAAPQAPMPPATTPEAGEKGRPDGDAG